MKGVISAVTLHITVILRMYLIHRTLCKRINANKANAHNSDNEEKNKRLILRFRCTWCHPVLSELSDDLSLQVYYSPEPLISHLKNYSPPPNIIRPLNITQQLEEMLKSNNLQMWKNICKGY